MDGFRLDDRSLTRRDLLRGGGIAIAVTASMAGCDLLATEPDGDSGGGSRADTGGSGTHEAPMLAQRVEAGELPPVEERLPLDPVVVEPVDSVGEYGGTWNTAMQGPQDVPWLVRTVGYEPPLRWSPNLSEVLPNVVEDIEASADGSEYVLRLRPGLKWSDGAPFTADDVVFAQNDVANIEGLPPLPNLPSATAETVDEHTVRITFDQPEGLFLRFQAIVSDLVSRPRHFLEEFHRDYNPDVDALVAEEGAADWIEFFNRKINVWENKDLPRLHAWVPTTSLGEGTRMVFTRNPYYWKVDPDGNQLPYIDEVVFDVVDDAEVMLLNAANGDLDMHVRHFNSLANKPVLADGREEGNYRFFDTVSSNMNGSLLLFNLTISDPVKREIFRNKDFRIGLSHAIDRPEVIDAVFQRQGEPWQAAPRPESSLYDEEMAKQYTEYDVDLANESLDRAGYAERDGDGFRLGPDGERISFTLEYATGIPFVSPPELFELVRTYWSEVGVDVQVQPEARELLLERNAANEIEMFTWWGDGGLKPIEIPDWYFPDRAYLEWAKLWSDWYATDGKDGEEPIDPAKRQMELYDQLKATADSQEQESSMRQLLDIAKEEFWIIGTVLPANGYGIVKNNFHNVPLEQIEEAQIPTPGPTHPEQYFITEE